MSQPTLIENLDQASSAAWTAHPKFPGVTMKAVVGSALTGGAVSQHLVRVDAGCALETHVHAQQCELHLVLAGSGEARLAGEPTAYLPGNVSVIPAGSAHSVRAGADGLMLLASFTPALG